MILLGYDIVNQATVAGHQGTTIVCNNSDRARVILNGLCDVAENIPANESVALGTDDNGVEVIMMVHTPWVKSVQYSDQAWNDLLSVADEVRGCP